MNEWEKRLFIAAFQSSYAYHVSAKIIASPIQAALREAGTTIYQLRQIATNDESAWNSLAKEFVAL